MAWVQRQGTAIAYSRGAGARTQIQVNAASAKGFHARKAVGRGQRHEARWWLHENLLTC